MGAERYDRQERIEGWNQAALTSARVLVAGAGALGNELIKNLALLGVGHILVIDFDLIERSNLSRTALFREPDVGRPKAAVAAAAARALNPAADVRFLDGNLYYDVGLGLYRHGDLAVGCLDSLAARSRVGISCTQAGIPYLDGGIWSMGGEARWFVPGDGPCFECTLSDDDRVRAFERRSCTGFRLGTDDAEAVPTSITSAAIIGGVLAQEAARRLCGFPVHDGEAAVYNGLTLSMHRTAFSRDPACPYHAPYPGIVELPWQVAEVTALTVLRQAEEESGQSPVLELGRDYLVGFDCPECGAREFIGRHLSRVDEVRAVCPQCGALRTPDAVSRLDLEHPHVNCTLAALGVPPGEVLAVRTGEVLRFYEFSGDVDRFWSKSG